MKEFFRLLAPYFVPYKRFIVGTFALNILAAMFNVFSFALLVPILHILFNIDDKIYVYQAFTAGSSIGETIDNFVTAAKNNGYYYSQQLVDTYGPATTLLILGLILTLLTLLKTSTYFGGSACLMPIKTGIVRDIRAKLYRKILYLPLAFFSEERKGDILARISTDVNEVDASIGSSLDMIIKNPIFIIVYITTLLCMSWQLTLFVLIVVPFMAIGIGRIGKRLKSSSLKAQARWSDGLSIIEETLGGLRIIKAFIAERKMEDKFVAVNNEYRRISMRVAIRQSSAHPVSEFLGTLMIVIVLWFGGYLIFAGLSPIDASAFIYYLTILYTTLQPVKDLSKAGYTIQKGMASMERINKILDAENNITERPDASTISGLNQAIELRNVSFAYSDGREVLTDINLTIPRGQTIALVGQSGSGKSTLVDLIPRYHDIQHGIFRKDSLGNGNAQKSDISVYRH